MNEGETQREGGWEEVRETERGWEEEGERVREEGIGSRVIENEGGKRERKRNYFVMEYNSMIIITEDNVWIQKVYIMLH